jgi:hypothetical protein
MLHRVDCETVTDVSKEGTAVILRYKQSKNGGLFFDCLIEVCSFELSVTIEKLKGLHPGRL